MAFDRKIRVAIVEKTRRLGTPLSAVDGSPSMSVRRRLETVVRRLFRLDESSLRRVFILATDSFSFSLVLKVSLYTMGVSWSGQQFALDLSLMPI